MKTTKILQLAMIGFSCLCAATPAQSRERILLSRYTGNWDGRETTVYVARKDGSGERQLLTTPGYDYAASFSFDQRWVIFTSERAGSPDIYRVRADGSGMEQLTDDPAMDDQAALSPDGRQLAFVSTRARGSADIWVMDMNARRLRNLTNGAGSNFRPSWSPDGQWLAFSSDRGFQPRSRGNGRFEQTHETSIYIARANGSGLRRLTPAGLYAGSPKWSADSKHIVFYQSSANEAFDTAIARGAYPPDRQADPNNPVPMQGGGGAPNQSIAAQIVSMEVATGQTTTLTNGPGFKVGPQFVGNEVGYVVKNGPLMGINFTRSGRGAALQLRDASWSADGAQVVYHKLKSWPLVQNQPLYGKLPQEFELVWSHPFPAVSRSGRVAVSAEFARGTHTSILRRDGSVERVLSDNSDASEALHPSWSPDEQWIVYGQGRFFRGAAAPAGLVLARVDGSERKILDTGPGNAGFPSFAPDGKHIVFRNRAENAQGLHIVNIEDGRVRVLTSGRDDLPMWSPDGNLIAFTRAVGDGFDLFTIRPDGTDLKQLTDAPGHDAHCTWSPDGRYLVFSSGRFGFKDELALYYDWSTQSYTELFVMNADGSNQRQLTDNKWEDGTALWVPATAAP